MSQIATVFLILGFVAVCQICGLIPQSLQLFG